MLEAQDGVEIDVGELSMEEDADFKEDCKPQIELMWCTQPLTLVHWKDPSLTQMTVFNLSQEPKYEENE